MTGGVFRFEFGSPCGGVRGQTLRYGDGHGAQVDCGSPGPALECELCRYGVTASTDCAIATTSGAGRASARNQSHDEDEKHYHRHTVSRKRWTGVFAPIDHHDPSHQEQDGKSETPGCEVVGCRDAGQIRQAGRNR
jgi:hypothetical protein